MRLYKILLASLFITVACSQEPSSKLLKNQVPKDWYNGEEDAKSLNPDDLDDLPQSVDSIFKANAEALEEGTNEINALALSPMAIPTEIPSKGKPKDWVPWHAEYFMTDLSLTGSGLIGALTFNGTATMRAYWRKQGPEEFKFSPQALSEVKEDDPSNSMPVVMVQEDSTPEIMVKQLEPAISAAIASGKIKDTSEMRKNLFSAAQDFHSIAMSIPSNSDELPWWVSRFRLDFTISAAGRVEPVGIVGGEVRFRFEWHRVQRTSNSISLLDSVSTPITEKQLNLRKGIKNIIEAMSTDLYAALGDQSAFGFKAHQIRVGLGISVKGNIGIIKGSAGLVGQLYFTRNVQKPMVRPRSYNLALNEDAPLYVIERHPAQNQLEYAAKNNLLLALNKKQGTGFEEAVYKFNREKFRKSLAKTARIGKFFAERATKAHVNNWKVYEFRMALDTSISGTLSLVTLAGNTTSQISFFNEKF